MARDVAECTLVYCASVRALALRKLAPLFFIVFPFAEWSTGYSNICWKTQISGLGCQSEMISSRGKRVKQRFVSDLNGQQGHFKTNRDSGMNYLKRSVITILNLINQIKLEMKRCPVPERKKRSLVTVLSQISTNRGILNQQLNCNILLLCTSTSHRLHLFRFKQLQ